VRTAGHVKLTTSLWAVLLGMIVFAFFVLVGGHLSDKGAPKVGENDMTFYCNTCDMITR
jgi:hypothetical protein